jgi:hypothetical protein
MNNFILIFFIEIYSEISCHHTGVENHNPPGSATSAAAFDI